MAGMTKEGGGDGKVSKVMRCDGIDIFDWIAASSLITLLKVTNIGIDPRIIMISLTSIQFLRYN